MKQDQYLANAPRGLEVGAGIILALLSLGLLGAGGLVLYRLVTGRLIEAGVFWVGVSALVIGAVLSRLSLRLVAGERDRSDGGLLSPTSLRLAGACFVIAPVLMIFENWIHLIHLAASISCAVACFLLAARREQLTEPHRGGCDS